MKILSVSNVGLVAALVTIVAVQEHYYALATAGAMLWARANVLHLVLVITKKKGVS